MGRAIGVGVQEMSSQTFENETIDLAHCFPYPERAGDATKKGLAQLINFGNKSDCKRPMFECFGSRIKLNSHRRRFRRNRSWSQRLRAQNAGYGEQPLI